MCITSPSSDLHHFHSITATMAPTDKIRCLACKKKGEKLEDWEFDADPLGPDELGQTVQHPDLRLLCWHQLLCTCVSAQTERLSALGHQHWEPRAKHARQPSLLRAELSTHHDLLD